MGPYWVLVLPRDLGRGYMGAFTWGTFKGYPYDKYTFLKTEFNKKASQEKKHWQGGGGSKKFLPQARDDPQPPL